MQWVDEALILDCGKYAEHAAIVHLFTREHGRCSGLSKAALSSRNRATYQPGNLVHAAWKARLPEHMGTVTCEMVQSFSAIVMTDMLRLSGMSAACALVKACLPERDPHPALYEQLRHLLLCIAHEESLHWQMAYARFELSLLRECGMGLDLTECAATGQREELVYVSPKSGRAVSREAGRPYHDKLLPLPDFLVNPEEEGDSEGIQAALQLTGYFLDAHWSALHHQELPGSRARLVALLSR